MNTQQTVLEFNAEYASQVMTQIPYGYIDKTVCACGLSTLALENDKNTIIAVPSTELIENKVAQYPNERFGGEIFGVLGGVSIDDINNWILNNDQQPIKIMVTYDSLWKVEHLLNVCDIVIDESNELLTS